MRKYIYPEGGYYTENYYMGRMPDGSYKRYVSGAEDEYGTDYEEQLKKLEKGES